MNIRNKIPCISANFLLRDKNSIENKYSFANSNKKNSILEKFHSILPKNKIFYPLLGIYIFITTFITFSLFKNNDQYQSLIYSYNSLILINISFGVILFTMPFWAHNFKNIGFLVWISSVLFPLISIENTIILINKFNFIYSLIFVLNLIVIYQFFRGILALAMITLGYSLNVLSFLLVTNENILNQSVSLNMIYAAIFMGITLFVLLIGNKQNEETINQKQENLTQENNRISEELIKALEHQERFIYALDSECIEAFVTLHQIGKDLTHKLELATTNKEIREISHHFLTILNQNQHAAHYLIQIIYQIKDHLRLDVDTININNMINNLQQKANALKISTKTTIDIINNSNYDNIECDHNKINNLISESIQYLIRKNDNGNPINIILQEAKLEYKISFMKNYSRKIDALKIIITNDIELKNDKKVYSGNTGMPSIILPRTTDELHRKFSENILDAHYGAANTILKPSGTTQIYVIPKNIREVRPKVMDLEEMEVPSHPKSNVIIN